MADKTYEDGLRDGKIANIEGLIEAQRVRSNYHGDRLGRLEKLMYISGGVMVTLNAVVALPALRNLLLLVIGQTDG